MTVSIVLTSALAILLASPVIAANAFIQQTKLTTGESIGWNVAISADGNTALVGAGSDEGGVGAAWVFVRTGTTWTQQGSKLTGAGEIGTARFGESVALSGDGNTALIGGREDNGERGAAWVFVRKGATWSQQGEKLTGAGESGREERGEFGDSVALSSDGKTALVGGGWDNGGEGAAWVFTRSFSTWSQQGPKLTVNDGFSEFATNVALSADGNTALMGGWYDNTGTGAAWVFTRSGSSWTQQGPKLTGTGEIGEGWFGQAVALSPDGNVALIGAPNDNHSAGAAWIFTRSGNSWIPEGSKIRGAGEIGDGGFGEAVALSLEGNTALVGGSASDNGTGGVWDFARSGGTWTQPGERLTDDEALHFGRGLALSDDGDTALIGGEQINSINSLGALWVFANPSPSVITGQASGIKESSAVLDANIEPGPATTVYFQYGTSEAYGARTPSQAVSSSTSATMLNAQLAALEPQTTYHYRVVSENSLGTTYGQDRIFTTSAAPTSTSSAPTPPVTIVEAPSSSASTSTTLTSTALATPPGSTATPAPVVASVRQTNRVWRTGARLPRHSSSHKHDPVGTTFSFTLSESANVMFTFERELTGHSVDGRCVARSLRSHGGPACRRPGATQGIFSFAGSAGENRVLFTGLIPRATLLQPGQYILLIAATNSAGRRSAATAVSFAVVK